MSHAHGKGTGFLPRRSLVQAQFPPQPVCWPALEDDEQATRLEELDDWTRWLVNRYALDHRVVPACWAEHGAILEELSALHTAWQTAYAQDAKGDAPMEWHTHFALARQRLTDWVSRTGCRPGEHRGALIGPVTPAER